MSASRRAVGCRLSDVLCVNLSQYLPVCKHTGHSRPVWVSRTERTEKSIVLNHKLLSNHPHVTLWMIWQINLSLSLSLSLSHAVVICLRLFRCADSCSDLILGALTTFTFCAYRTRTCAKQRKVLPLTNVRSLSIVIQEVWANARETRDNISLISYAGFLGQSPLISAKIHSLDVRCSLKSQTKSLKISYFSISKSLKVTDVGTPARVYLQPFWCYTRRTEVTAAFSGVRSYRLLDGPRSGKAVFV